MIEIIRQTRRLFSRVAARTFIFPDENLSARARTYVEATKRGYNDVYQGLA